MLSSLLKTVVNIEKLQNNLFYFLWLSRNKNNIVRKFHTAFLFIDLYTTLLAQSFTFT